MSNYRWKKVSAELPPYDERVALQLVDNPDDKNITYGIGYYSQLSAKWEVTAREDQSAHTIEAWASLPDVRMVEN